MITFDPKKHKYTDEKGREFISVTTLLGREFPFDGPAIAKKLVKLEGHRYFGWDYKVVLK